MAVDARSCGIASTRVQQHLQECPSQRTSEHAEFSFSLDQYDDGTLVRVYERELSRGARGRECRLAPGGITAGRSGRRGILCLSSAVSAAAIGAARSAEGPVPDCRIPD